MAWKGSRNPSGLSAVVQVFKDLTQKQVKGTHRCIWSLSSTSSLAQGCCHEEMPCAVFQQVVTSLPSPKERSGSCLDLNQEAVFLANESLKCPLLLQHEKRSGCIWSSKRQNSRATILKLGNKRRHPRFYRMYWWQLIPKADKNRSVFFSLRNSDSLGLIILCCEGLSSESDFEQYPGSPPTRCQQHPHSRHDNQDDSGHCQRCWEAKPSPNENHQNRISGSLKESRQFPCRKQKKRRHRTRGMLMDTEHRRGLCILWEQRVL